MIAAITTVTTVAGIAVLGVSTFFSIAAVVTLIVLLASRELAGSATGKISSRYVTFASIGILPMVIAFGMTVLIKIIDLL